MRTMGLDILGFLFTILVATVSGTLWLASQLASLSKRDAILEKTLIQLKKEVTYRDKILVLRLEELDKDVTELRSLLAGRQIVCEIKDPIIFSEPEDEDEDII